MSQTLKDLLNDSFERHAERTAVRVLRQPEEPGERRLQYVPLTYQQLKTQRDRLASGLAQLGLEKGQRIGLLTDGGLESVLVFLSCDILGLSAVPICNKLPDDLLVHSINHSGIAYLFTDERSLEQVERVRDHLNNPPQIILTEGQGDNVLSFFDLTQKGAESPPPDIAIEPDDESKSCTHRDHRDCPKAWFKPIAISWAMSYPYGIRSATATRSSYSNPRPTITPWAY